MLGLLRCEVVELVGCEFIVVDWFDGTTCTMVAGVA